MRKRYCTIVALLVIGHLLTELHTFIMWISPDAAYFYVDNWFLKPGFKVDHLSVLWYFKMIEDGLLIALVMYAGACQAYSKSYEAFLQWQRYSFRLYTIWLIYFLYHLFDLVMFLYNYKRTYWLYIVVLSVTTTSGLLVGFANKRLFMRKDE